MNFTFDEARFLQDSIGLLRIKSENRDVDMTEASPLGEGVHAAIRYTLELGRACGFATKDIDGYCGYIEMGEGKDMIGILTHIDTVPVGDGWDSEPFDGVVRDGKLYGRGTADNKGPTILSLHAMQAIHASGVKLNKRIRLIVGGDEESGIWRCMERYKQTEELPTCAFSPDGAYPATYAEKGILRVKISRNFDAQTTPINITCGVKSNIVPAHASAEISGRTYEATGKSAHSMAPCMGENALFKLCADLRNKGFQHPFLELVKMADVQSLNIALADEPSGKLTINPSMATTTATYGELICDIRYPVTVQDADILHRIEGAVAPLGFMVEKISMNAPLYLPKDLPFIQTLQQAYRDVTGDATPPASTGGCTYARAFSNAVAFGAMLPTTQNTAHQANEFWALDEIRTNFSIITKTLLALQH